MRRQLPQSFRDICRRRCNHRLYSMQAAAIEHRTSGIPNGRDKAEDLKHEPSSAGEPSRSRKTMSTEVERDQLLMELKVQLPMGGADAYLASLRAGGIEPTIQDLSRLAPTRMHPVNSPRYVTAYTELRERLCRTFSKSQLQRFCRELKLGQRSERKKVEYAEAIIEKHWGWENLKELEKRKKDTSEVVIKTIPVSASQLFLLLGKDGSELLQISRDYNVHISVTPNPLCIRVEGFKATIRRLETMILERRKSIIEEKVELHLKEPLSASLLQRVSRTANAFIENLQDDGKIRIRANTRQRLNLAKRLILRAAVQVRHTRETAFAALLPPLQSALRPEESPPSYALFPFVPHRSLPWISAAGSTFRSRKVGIWFGDSGENLASLSGGNTGAKGMLSTMEGKLVTLENIIRRSFENSADNYLITASTGHILIMADSKKASSSILPPLAGRWQYSELLDWLKKDAANRIFVPCLPPPLHSAPPSHEHIIHRLAYRLLPDTSESSGHGEAQFCPEKVIQAEVVINRTKLEDSDSSIDEPESSSEFKVQEDTAINSELEKLFIDEYTLQDRPSEAADNIDQSAEREASNILASAGDVSAALCENVSEASSAVDASLDESHIVSDSEAEPTDNVKAKLVLDGDSTPESANASEPEFKKHSDSIPSCRKGTELELLIALPDRPTDLKLTVLGSVISLPVDNIPELHEYFEALKAYLDNSASQPSPPEPPLFIQDNGDKYILELNASIRRSNETIALDHASAQGLDSDSFDVPHSRRISTMTESIYDLESGQKLVNCEVACNTAPAGEAWASFLRDVEEIVSLGYNTKKSPPKDMFSFDNHPSSEDIDALNDPHNHLH